jgi:hypothetical protein
MNAEQIWTKRNHELLAIGAVWGVPRSGLIFKKTADGFELINVMPYLPEMSSAFAHGKDVPASPSELRMYQIQDYVLLSVKHEEAGLRITDPQKLLEKYE